MTHARSPKAEQDRYQRSLVKKAQKEFKRKWISNHTFVDFELAETVSQTTDQELEAALWNKFHCKLIRINEIVKGEVFADSRGRGSHQIYGGEIGL